MTYKGWIVVKQGGLLELEQSHFLPVSLKTDGGVHWLHAIFCGIWPVYKLNPVAQACKNTKL